MSFTTGTRVKFINTGLQGIDGDTGVITGRDGVFYIVRSDDPDHEDFSARLDGQLYLFEYELTAEDDK